MSEAPERIWAVTKPDDISADILGDVYAQQVPDGMVGTPVEYVRADRIEELEAKLAKAMKTVAAAKEMYETAMLTAGGSPVAWSEHIKARNAFSDTLAELTGGKDGT